MDSSTTLLDEGSLALPPTPNTPEPPGFPLVASLAPLVASCAIWAVTGSMFALVFAGLSPVIALASLADSRRHSRRARKIAARKHAEAMVALRGEIEEFHERERSRRVGEFPNAHVLMRTESRLTRWTAATSRFAEVTIGAGLARSTLRVTGTVNSGEERDIVETSKALEDAPICADARLGIGVIGPPTATAAIARGYLLQLAHAFPPGMLRIGTLPKDGWEWARDLPHLAEAERVLHIVAESDPAESSGAAERDRGAVIAFARSVSALPVPCRVVIAVDSPGKAHLIAGGASAGVGTETAGIVPELIARREAAAYAAELAVHARSAGYSAAPGALPASVAFCELEQCASDTLNAVVGRDRDGVLELDLVADGPHAIVGGTTGSGKSELLVTWVTAMAAAHPPAQVRFLLVDFKGGSAFEPLTALPHCVGLITDLAHGEAERALRSLAAELKHREQVLARLGVRDIAESAGELGRLVIVVDEFAAMLDTFDELHSLFVDIAARGRSLGVHAILCTQRPAGVVRDALLANCALRLSLRVHDAADSVAVVGTDAASTLSATQPGRCVVARDGDHTLAQIAETTREDVGVVAAAVSASSSVEPVRRPWLDPLPPLVALESLQQASAGEVILGIEDVPEEQRQSLVTVRPDSGHLLVLGVHGSGKSALCDSVAAQWRGESCDPRGNLEQLWDALVHTSELCEGTTVADDATTVVFLDDLDALFARLPEEYRDPAADMITRILRDGPAAGVSVVATMQRMTPMLRATASLFTHTVLLKQPTRQEHVLAGGHAAGYDERSRPGAGEWLGHRIQLAYVAPRPEHAANTGTIDRVRPSKAIVVSARPAVCIRALQAAGSRDVVDIDAGAEGPVAESDVLVGTAAAWQARWGLFESARGHRTILFDGCTIAEFRALLHTRSLPPLTTGRGRLWQLSLDGELSRVVLGA